MKKATKYLFNSLAGVLFIALMAINIQIGNGKSFLGLGNYSFQEARAELCDPPHEVICAIIDWPDDTITGYKGEPVVITPEEE